MTVVKIRNSGPRIKERYPPFKWWLPFLSFQSWLGQKYIAVTLQNFGSLNWLECCNRHILHMSVLLSQYSYVTIVVKLIRINITAPLHYTMVSELIVLPLINMTHMENFWGNFVFSSLHSSHVINCASRNCTWTSFCLCVMDGVGHCIEKFCVNDCPSRFKKTNVTRSWPLHDITLR